MRNGRRADGPTLQASLVAFEQLLYLRQTGLWQGRTIRAASIAHGIARLLQGSLFACT